MRNVLRQTLVVLAVALMACTACTPSSRDVRGGGHGTASLLGQLEAAVDGMRLYQRRAENLAFYDCYVRAERLIGLIGQEVEAMTPDEALLFQHEKDDFYLISVTYQHTMGHHDRAVADMNAIREEGLAERDTAQWLHYRLLRSMAAHVDDAELARQAWTLSLFGDSAYWATEARIHQAAAMNREGLYLEALDTLQLAYDCIADDNVPECLCRISEQVSVAYAGLEKKDSSDIYRNIYLDMLEVIRENKELEYRSQELERRTTQVERLSWGFLVFVVVFIIGFSLLAVVARRRHRMFTARMEEQHDERLEEFHDEMRLHRSALAENKRAYVRRKATIAIVTSIIPYIDRMRHAMQTPEGDFGYICELAGRVEELTDVLAGWIQTRQGMVNLHVETFDVEGLFDILAQRRGIFAEQGLELTINGTDAVVKADKALTLFMLNTLMDNARKFTPQGGHITLDAVTADDYVELSVSDTGIGLAEEDVRELLDSKVYDVTRIGDAGTEHGSGFGLMNCKGIIEKYRKTDSFFSVCKLGIDSKPGEGSRFWFRLPRAVRKALVVLVLFVLGATGTHAQGMLETAAAWADSVYYANLAGRYDEAITFGDSALHYLNADMRSRDGSRLDTLTIAGARGGETETEWWMSDFETDYYTILDVRNELAIAFLALHRLDDYKYNNRAYTELYKLTSEDTTLADYIGRMQESRQDMVTMLAIGLLLLLAFIACWLAFIVRPRRVRRSELERRNRELERLVDEDSEMRRVRYEENRLHVQNMVLDNCLSTIKHETSYYPGRIRQMAERLGAMETPDGKLLGDMAELTDFYRDIFGTLASCAARQLEESPFRRQDIPCEKILDDAAAYLHGRGGTMTEMAHDGSSVSGDGILLGYLMECLIDETDKTSLSLTAEREGNFVVFRFTDHSQTLSANEMQELFYPSDDNMGYIICRQIIREHDEYFGHIGCRIKAERSGVEGGLTIVFTLPAGAESRALQMK